MTDQTTTTAPTVTSNREAAKTACDHERDRVVRLLALAPEGTVPEAILQAVANGTPAAVFASGQRVRAARAASNAGVPGAQPVSAQASGAGRGKWGAITSRLNEQRRAAVDASDADGPAT
ncbi:MAG: hypothetical protein R3E75_08155 [Steroidobacteraceae bacterium]|nr:hypothetical protein [Nevskiaceae bacterium]MCP5359886.1 hypothetical protein [Nevskiaceae bacterium]MCP5472294.1 hypothetical protein [Nevskiaceae bacterium]